MDYNRLRDILDETTVQLRKGEVEIEKDYPGVKVVQIQLMPHESEFKGKIVDVHFVKIGILDGAEKYKDEFSKIMAEIVAEYPRMRDGPSYIEAGAILDSQGAALRLFALGEALGMWNVITPERLMPGISQAQAEDLAGSGLVMFTGYKGGV